MVGQVCAAAFVQAGESVSGWCCPVIARLKGRHEQTTMSDTHMILVMFSFMVEQSTFPDLRLTVSDALATGSRALGLYGADKVPRMWR